MEERFRLAAHADGSAADESDPHDRARWPQGADTVSRGTSLFIVTAIMVFGPPTAVTASDAKTNPAVAWSFETIFGRELLRETADDVHRKALQLATDERIDYLLAQVLPAAPHRLRLSIAFPSSRVSPDSRTHSPQRHPISPLWDLIDACKDQQRLDELLNRLSSLPESDLLSSKNRSAALAMTLFAMDRSEDGMQETERFAGLARMPQPDNREYRTADALLFSMTGHRPEVREILQNNMTRIVQQYRVRNQWTPWERQFRGLLAGQDVPPATRQWSSTSVVTAESRGNRIPPAQWQFFPGQVANTVSHGDDYSYYQSPLTGSFQVECDFSAFAWRDTELLARGTWVAPVYTHKEYDTGDVRWMQTRKKLDPPLQKISGKLHYRTVARDDLVTTFVNGRRLHSQPVESWQDPWLAIRNRYKNEGQAFNVRITGTPVIPTTIRMTAHPQLQGWLPYYGGSVGWSDSCWQGLYKNRLVTPGPDQDVSGGGILGTHNLPTAKIGRVSSSDFASATGLSGTRAEEALFYHRPMLEDGTISYEFYYQEGEFAAHPALDRLCFLIQPSGVRLHRLTDGAFERSELSPDNSAPADADISTGGLPIINNSWNRASLTLTGDIARITLNDQVVCRQKLRADNQRRFGFFFYADRSELRVRNVLWSGNWPKQLPPVAKQYLASDDGDFLNRDADHLKQSFDYDFAAIGLQTDRLSVIRGTRSKHFRETPEGLLVTRPGTAGYQNATIAPNISVTGDFDITLTYQAFKAQVTRGSGSTLMLVAMFDNPTNDEVIVMRRHMKSVDGKEDQQIHGATVEGAPQGQKRDYFIVRTHEETSGRLRLARRGATVHYLVSEEDSPNFRLLGSREFSDAPLKYRGIRIINQCHQRGHSEVVWTALSVRAEGVSGEQAVSEPKNRTKKGSLDP